MFTSRKANEAPQRLRRGGSRFGALRRVFAFCAVAALAATLTTQFGWMNRLEIASSDLASFSNPKASSGETIIVAVDAETIKVTGKYPYDRRLTADVLDVLREAGADRIFYDSALVISEDAAGDEKLARAIAALGPDRIGLPISRIGAGKSALPLSIFAEPATIVSAEFVFDADSRIRSIAAYKNHRTVGDWLARREARPDGRALALDYNIQPRSFPQYGIRDVAAGKVPPAALKGKTVVIGLMLDGQQTAIEAPIHKRLPRTIALAIAAESARVGFERPDLGVASRYLVALAFCLAFGLLISWFSAAVGFVGVVAGSVGWLYTIGALQPKIASPLPVIAPVLAAIIVWQGLSFGRSRLAIWLRRRYLRFVGMGQTALITAIEVMGEPAFVFDRRGAIVGSNNPFRTMLTAAGAKTAAMERASDIFGEAFAAAAAQASESGVATLRLDLSGGGRLRHYDATIRVVSTMNGQFGVAGLRDVTDAVDREAALATLAYRDSLTGLANRAAFRQRLAVLSADPRATRFSILLIDLDGFKQVNDSLGHHAGDLLLREVAMRLQALMREGDMAARLGGDEFAVLMADADRDAASRLAQVFLAALAAPFNLDGETGRVGASIGIACWPEHGAHGETVLRLADMAMYAAKRNKPAYAVHSPEGVDLFRAA